MDKHYTIGSVDKLFFRKIIECVFVSLIILCVEWFYFGFNNLDFASPLFYNGGDAFYDLAKIKMLWEGNNYRLGWPYHTEYVSYRANYDLLFRLFIGYIHLYTDNVVVAQNLYLLVLPFLNVFIAYLVFCNLGIKKFFSLLGALLYGFSPYVQFRFLAHHNLTGVEFIPLVFLMCVWIYEDDEFCAIKKVFFRYKRNCLAIVFAFLIAYNGAIYYPFFSCFILLVVGFVASLKSKNVKKLFEAFVVIIQIAFWVAISFIPSIIGMAKGLGNVASNGQERNAIRAAYFALDIRSLILSPKGYGIPALFEKYKYIMADGKEQYYSYLGIVGVVGFVILILFLMRENKTDSIEISRISLLAKINIMLVILGVGYGFGMIVALFIPDIASYNRVSPFILFGCILAVLIIAQDFFAQNCNKYKQIVYVVVVVGIMFYALYEQYNCYGRITKEANEEAQVQLQQDATFFSEMEMVAGENSLIYMLPYMKTFENGASGQLHDYENYRGYLNTKSIRWSYGDILDGENDVWYRESSQLEPKVLIDELRAKDFSGVYINMCGYNGEEGIVLAEELLKDSGADSYLVHENGYVLYIPLN